MRSRNCVVIGLAFALLAGAALAQTIPNWTAPPTWTPSKGMTATTMADLSNPVPFIPVTPCRVADTRNPNGAYGGPALVGALTRDFTIGGQCGIPSGAEAVSFNFTITGGTAAGDLRFYPAGSVLPLVSTINWGPTTGTLANAAVVPLGTAGAITVKNDSAAAVHLIIDVNGYYAAYINSSEYFGVIGDHPGGVIYGQNNTTSGGYGVRGYVPSGGAGAAGVLGEYAGSAAGYGVRGTSVSAINAVGVIGRDQSSTVTPFGSHSYLSAGLRGESANSVGVMGLSNYMAGGFENYTSGNSMQSSAYLAFNLYGVMASSYGTTDNTSVGVSGMAYGATGKTYGVWGQTATSALDSAGVIGIDGTGRPTGYSGCCYSAGVHGESADRYGVVGVSNWVSVLGTLRDGTSGALLANGILGTTLHSGPWAVYGEGNIGASGTKPFIEVHPTDARKVIRYVALEGPEAGTYFRGKGRFVGRTAVIEVPESFRLVTDPEGLTIQVTPIGDLAAVAVVSIGLDQIELKSSRDVEFFYTVNGVRETFKDWQVIVDDSGYMPESADATLPNYFSPRQKQRLIANGTYNEDGTVNLNTAERLGWAQKWRDREAAAQKAAEEAAAKAATAAAQRERENPREP